MRKGVLIGAGLVTLVALLLGAAYVGGQLLGQKQDLGGFIAPGSKESAAVSSFRIEKPDELPEEPSAVAGTVRSIEGKRITVALPQSISSGGVVRVGGTADSTPTPDPNEKLIEVIVTQETTIYKSEALEKEGGKLKQKLSEVDLDAIQPGDYVVVWGEKSGDRVTAEVIHTTGVMAIRLGN